MVEIEFRGKRAAAQAALEKAAASLDLQITRTGTLATAGHAPHWHLKRGHSAGVLEVTYWPEEGRGRVSYHANRAGDGWVSEVAPQLAAALTQEMESD